MAYHAPDNTPAERLDDTGISPNKYPSCCHLGAGQAKANQNCKHFIMKKI
jgi:hypothetical protein